MRRLFGWLVADGWCWFVMKEEYCWLVAGGWFVVREKYCWLVADKPSEQGVLTMGDAVPVTCREAAATAHHSEHDDDEPVLGCPRANRGRQDDTAGEVAAGEQLNRSSSSDTTPMPDRF
jgi:hypothetical protein